MSEERGRRDMLGMLLRSGEIVKEVVTGKKWEASLSRGDTNI